MFRGALDDLQVFVLFGIQRGLREQLREADHAVDRCADLVAHVGQELRLHPAGLLGAAAGEVEFHVLDLQLLQRAAQLGVGLVDLPLQLLPAGLQRLGHRVDAALERAELATGGLRHPPRQLTAAEAAHGMSQAHDRDDDVTADRHGQQVAQKQPHRGDQQAVEQHLELPGTGAAARELDFHLAGEAVAGHVQRRRVAWRAAQPLVQPAAEPIAGPFVAGRAAATDPLVARPVEDADGLDVATVDHLRDQLAQQLGPLALQRDLRRRRELVGQRLAAGSLGVGQILDPRVHQIEADDHGNQRRRHQRQQQHAIADSPVLQHGRRHC